MSGRLGAASEVLIYQAMQLRDEAYWASLQGYRLLVILDEIHHCGGDMPGCLDIKLQWKHLSFQVQVVVSETIDIGVPVR